MNINLVKKLREISSAPMNDCKLALEEANLDFDKALDLIKIKGLQTTARNASNASLEGRIGIFTTGLNGALIEVNCQTDFTSNCQEFKDFTSKLVLTFIDFEGSFFDGNLSSLEMQEDYDKLSASTKENIIIKRWGKLTLKNGRIFSYLHSNGKIGVLVGFSAPEEIFNDSAFKDFGENVAMQIAAMNPLAISSNHLSQEDVSHQTSIFQAQLKEANKPEASWDKIIAGKKNKWFSEVCLINQEAVFSPKKTIEALTNELSKKLCGEEGKISIVDFQRQEVGVHANLIANTIKMQ